MTEPPALSPFGQGWLAAADGLMLDANPFTTELDLIESESLSEPVLCADRWRDGYRRFSQ